VYQFMIEAILFDIDGVLVDSREANIALFQRLLTRAGYEKPTREEALACFHLPLEGSLAKLLKTEDTDEVKRVAGLVGEPGIRDPKLLEFPKTLEQTLETLHKKYKLGIVTSRIKLGVEDIFKEREIRHLFDAVVAYEDYSRPKPNPDPLIVALDRLGLSADQALYIGDSDSDIMAATAAGMPSIHLAPAKHTDATAGVAEFDELIQAIESLAGA
jgi:phosphoglycolate phosphatase-like HAD superfamily hydrolase